MSKNQLFEYRVGNALPFGVTKVPGGVQFAVYLPHSKKCFLKLYKKGKNTPSFILELTDKFKVGSVYFVIIEKRENAKDSRTIEEILSQDYEYMYEADGKEFVDPYADYVTGREVWGREIVDGHPVRGGICTQDFAWEDDTPLRIPYSDMILYQLHVRGYTKHSTSKVKHKGTFRGLIEKIPYLKDLGINAVLLLPVYEFCEIMPEQNQYYSKREEYKKDANYSPKINYWGYGTKQTYYFAPKAAYTSNLASPSAEFKELVREFHKNGIEIILDIYFAPGTNLFLMTDCLRSWVLKYHVDGFRVNQDVMPSLTLASDPILSGVKILTAYWDIDMLHNAKIHGQKNALSVFNEGFMNDARRFLKSDEGMTEKVAGYFSRNSSECSFINFMTYVNGFTLMDLVSYDIKHNEANGELNQDGTEFNYSWNCGVEGKTRKKVIMERRMTQIRNAFVMLMTSQSTPMILGGDELGNTQMGNNNAYCQDNPTTWIRWNKTAVSEQIHEFVKNIIQLRKNFKVLHQDNPIRMMDTLTCGMPDLSIHGIQAWKPDFSNYSRMLAMLYYGEYVENRCGKSLYIIFNMYWEAKSFDLPNLPKRRSWKLLVDTYANTFDMERMQKYKFPQEKEEKKKRKENVKLQKKTVVPPRSIVIFVEE